uniref:AlNc14C540G12101 protein n=1 Tax=Albugo laibachii Nc14 TaxID=890382 RepID=F0X114_9STRA|nr:AlNc14C540G12101 [Albugo laibachii Nc14]|eukprot:CCA27462.1 AlNc14C540G12101 [Albugo laibachii Nc14]
MTKVEKLDTSFIKFNTIKFDSKKIGEALAALVSLGSQWRSSQIHLKITCFILHGDPRDARTKYDSSLENLLLDENYSHERTADNLFVLYFTLLTQAKPPHAGLQMSNVIREITGGVPDMAHVADELATFDLREMDQSWTKHWPAAS